MPVRCVPLVKRNILIVAVEKQIAKMRELYDAVPDKPEWLTAEDIDRYEQRMGWDSTV